jgi:acyl carrier protein phosphodiesterase
LNYLAHFHLAWPDGDLVAGGLEGDYLKGPLDKHSSSGLQRGVQLHRMIDGFTDRHPSLTRLRDCFQPSMRRFSGILIDLSFDHFLSSHWSTFSTFPLKDFNREIYRNLEERRGHLSPGAQRMLRRLVQYDLLGRYADWDTVPATAERIGERFRRGNPFIGIKSQLLDLQPALEDAFLEFYPDLEDFAAAQVKALN